MSRLHLLVTCKKHILNEICLKFQQYSSLIFSPVKIMIFGQKSTKLKI